MKKKEKLKFVCKICNTEFYSTKTRKYCSKQCRYKDSYFKNRPPWNKGLDKNDIRIININKKRLKTIKRKYGKLSSWNKGLTKENDDILKKISEARMGSNNPIHKVLNDKQKYINFCLNVSKGIKKSVYIKNKKNKKLEDIFDSDKVLSYKLNMSNAAKNRKINGHTGHKHSEATKNKIREKLIKRMSEGLLKFTEPMQKFQNILNEINIGNFKTEFNYKFYCIDFADENKKIAIEIDGDFWHCNPRIYPNGPKYKIQEHNLMNDKRKEKFLKNRGWYIKRFWEYDINNNPEIVKEELLNYLKKIYEIN